MKMDGKLIGHPWVEEEGRLFTMRFPAIPNIEEFVGFTNATHAFYSRNKDNFAWVVDGGGIQVHGAQYRKVLSDGLERDRAHLGRYCCGMGIVVPNPLARGAAIAIMWVSPPSFPYRLFAEEPPAHDWAIEQLTALA